MKLINLATDGIVGDFKYDFTRKIAGGCVALGETDKNALVTTLAIALFGSAGDEEAIKIPARAEVRFAVGAKDYIVSRLFEEGGESAILTNGTESTVLAEGDDVTATIESLLELNKKAFKKLFLINKEQLAWALSAGGDIRESFIATDIGELITPEELANRRAQLRSEEAAILAKLDKVNPVTRKAIKTKSGETDEERFTVDSIRKNIEDVTTNLAKAQACEDATKAYYEQASALDALGANKADIEKKADLLEKSKLAASLKDFYADHINCKQTSTINISKKAVLEQERAGIEKRLSDAYAAEKRIQEETAYYANRMSEYNKAIRALMRDINTNPKDYKIHPFVQAAYKEADEQTALMELQRSVAIEEREKLIATVHELREKKAALRTRAEYKKFVEDGAVFEDRINTLADKIKESNELLNEYEARITALTAEERRLGDIIAGLKSEQDALDAAICGKFKTHEDAVNSDVIVKQALYAKHLVVSANEVELHSVQKKIDDVIKATEHYDSKLQAAIKRKGELEEHLGKFVVRKQLLEEKLSDYISFNKFKVLAEDIQYGDRCPICNGVVTIKKDVPEKDTKAVEEQLATVNGEIEKLESAIHAIEENIGQFTAAKTVSAQYLEALQETADAKKKIIDDILAEYGVDSVPALFDLLKGLIKKSKELTANIDKFHSIAVELARYTENYNVVVTDKARLVDETVPAEKKNLETLTAAYRENTNHFAPYKDSLNGEEATALLAKKQLVDKEYELIEDELAAKEAALFQITDQCINWDTEIAARKARAINVNVNGNSLEYTEVIVGAIGSDLVGLLDEADAAEESKDVAVTRLAALRKIIAEIEEDKAKHDVEIAAQGASIESADATTDVMYNNYEDKLQALGVSDMAGLDAIILDEATVAAYQKDIADYDETTIRMTERLNKLKEDINANQVHFDNRDKYKEELAELHNKEKDATSTLVDDERSYDDMVNRYNIIADANQDLTTVQSRIAGIEECDVAIKDGAIIAEDFAALVLAKASGIIGNISKDKYRIDMKEDGKIVLFNNERNRIVPESRYTREEKELFEMGLTTAYAKTIASLLGTEAFGTIVIKDEDCNKPGLALIAEMAKEYDLILLPESDAKFSKVVDKL